MEIKVIKHNRGSFFDFRQKENSKTFTKQSIIFRKSLKKANESNVGKGENAGN